MAKEAPPPITNAAQLDSAIVSRFKELLKLDADIDAAVAEHITPMKDERKELWSTLAAEVDLPKADISLFYKLFKRQEQSRTFEDEADGQAVREAHRMLFSALAKGQTLDFIDVLGTVGGKPKEPAKRKGVFTEKPETPPAAPAAPIPPQSHTIREPDEPRPPAHPGGAEGGQPMPAEPEGTEDQDPLTSPVFVPQRGQGAAAFQAGASEDDCPYKAGTQSFVAWMFGYYRAEGGASYDKGEPITSCRYSTGSPAWKHWQTGWNDAAKKDSKDAATVGAAAAVKGAAGADAPETAVRRKRATTAQFGTA